MRSRPGICFAIATVFSAALSVLAEPTPIPPSRPESDLRLIERIDLLHESACGYLLSWSEGVDGWLAGQIRDPRTPNTTRTTPLVFDEEAAVESEGSRLILSPIVETREYEGFKFGLKFRAKLSLPRLSERIDLILDSDYDDRDPAPDLNKPRDIGLRSTDNGAANLRLRLDDVWKFKTALEAGLKFKPEPVPRLGARGRITWKKPWLTARFTQRVFWESEDGFGERSTLDFEQYKKDVYMRRLSTSVLWSEGSDGVQGGQTLQLYRYLSKRRAVGLILGVYGPLEPSAHVDTYSARISWRQRIHRDWLFLEFEPGVDWPRDRDYQDVFIARVKFDIIFGDWIEGANGDRLKKRPK